MTAYGAFAALYDRLMEVVEYEAWARVYAALIHLAPNMRVADMACGTGEIALRLGRMGARVTGVDLAPEMIARAQEKARAWGVPAAFAVQDMRDFALPRRAEAVVCACDGVNYLLSAERTRAFFRAARAAIRPGGALAFDISSRYKLEHVLGNGFFGEERDEAAYLWQNRLDEKRHILRMDITFFVRETDGRYRRFEEEHEQRAHSAAELTAWLEAEGFQNVEVFGNQTFDPPGAEEERLHFLARRP